MIKDEKFDNFSPGHFGIMKSMASWQQSSTAWTELYKEFAAHSQEMTDINNNNNVEGNFFGFGGIRTHDILTPVKDWLRARRSAWLSYEPSKTIHQLEIFKSKHLYGTTFHFNVILASNIKKLKSSKGLC
jgi:hypothetical protein